MELRKFVAFYLVSLGRPCLSELTIDAPQNNELLDYSANATVNVLTSCYGNRVKAVGIYGDSTGILLGARLSETFSVISIDSTAELSNDQIAIRRCRYKLKIFTILAGSSADLHQILWKIKNTPWWNHMASFLILNWSADSDNNCSNAFQFLWIAWKMNLLNVKFLCVNLTKKVSLYSYNPYTRTAPDRWKLWSTFKGKDDHPWSLFIQEYQEGEDMCVGLDFDTTKDLGSYAIPVSVQEFDPFWHVDRTKTGIASFGGLEGTAAPMWFRAMNAEAKLLVRNISEPFIFTNENRVSIGILMDLKKGTSDVILNAYYYDELKNFTVTYPYLDGGLGIVTQVSRPISQLGKLNSVIDSTSRYGLYSIMLVTPILFKFLMRETFMSAVLDTIRVICNSCLPKLPNNTGAKIFLATLFSFQITILALYQGQLASLLTKSVYGRNVDTMQDLADLGHTIYAHKSFAYLFTDPIFDNRFVGLEIWDCLEYVLRDATAACVDDWDMLRSGDPDTKLHLSSDMVKKTSLVYALREDWPLEQRFNQILTTTVENGILWRLYTKCSERFTKMNTYIEELQGQTTFQVMTLRELSFAFSILGIGLGLAAITFILEIIIGSSKP